jgi:hypothetical protein
MGINAKFEANSILGAALSQLKSVNGIFLENLEAMDDDVLQLRVL